MELLENVDRNINNASDCFSNFVCTLCLKGDITQEATRFCSNCEVFLCLSCTNCHERLPLTASHKLLAASLCSSRDMPADIPGVLTERCIIHTTEMLKRYCGIHDQAICVDCETIFHKACGCIQDIADVADKIDRQKMINETQASLIKTTEKIQNVKTTLLMAINDLKTADQSALDAIQTFSTELNQILDELVQRTKKDLDKQLQKVESDLNERIQRVTTIMQELDIRNHQLENISYNNAQQFVNLKMTQTTISVADATSRQLVPCSVQILFTKDTFIKDYLVQLSSLGHVLPNVRLLKLGLYKVNHSVKYRVKIKEDKKVCDILGSCFVGSGSLLLADYINQKLKLFDMAKNSVTSFCNFSSKPQAVCSARQYEAAVSLDNKTIQFVSISDQLLEPTKVLRFHHECFGLSIVEDNMYVTGKDANLYVYTLAGTLLRQINKDWSGLPMFSSTRHVAVNGNIYVADINNGLITLDTKEQFVWKYSSSYLNVAYCVCTDGRGNVFVSGRDSHNVIQFGEDGQRLGEFITKSYNLKKPQSMCFDEKNSILIVTNDEDNEILLFTLE